ncbi:hypothetical protein GTHT12_03702 (plasmid) [Geobacillus thermodenitrificans]|uniref:aminoglycoside phosphotransferase family protein n=1 Tax=Geobacillus thermodenitrificans TaxID=33940 RepID=UPI000A291A56|nr:aminoglycoside phosphotransferase family protein [Geobacillus thermodenitrificans]ARP44571.1 hypothetical protein GTHT12_03702 [Geobacillus thermodenitrificans]
MGDSKICELIKFNYGITTYYISKIKLLSMNKVYKIITNKGEFILKIYPKSSIDRAKKSMETQLFVHNMLEITPKVILNCNKQLITETSFGYVTLQEFVIGHHNFDSSLSLVEKASRDLFTLHEILKLIPHEQRKPLYKSNKEIREEINFAKNILLASEKDNRKNFYKLFFKLLNIRSQIIDKNDIAYSPKYFQVIHGDIRPNNLIIDGDRLTFIDFDFSGNSDLLVEVCRAAILLSNFDLNKTILFIKKYFENNQKYMDITYVFENMLAYLLQSNFPINNYLIIDEEYVEEILKERIKLIEFCCNILGIRGEENFYC